MRPGVSLGVLGYPGVSWGNQDKDDVFWYKDDVWTYKISIIIYHKIFTLLAVFISTVRLYVFAHVTSVMSTIQNTRSAMEAVYEMFWPLCSDPCVEDLLHRYSWYIHFL